MYLRFCKFTITTILLLNLSYSNIIAAPLVRVTEAEDIYNYNYATLTKRCEVYDPLEKLNRLVLYFNGALDIAILRPLAVGYGRFSNQYARNRVNSFLANLAEPISTINYAVQGNPNNTLKTFWRFMINSTFGIGGLFDVASEVGLEAEPQTFGNSLAYYGVGTGPYIMLPFLGPTTLRDITNFPLTSMLHPWQNGILPDQYTIDANTQNTIFVLSTIHDRYNVIAASEYLSDDQTDLYIAIRNASVQQREDTMNYPENFICPKVNK